jgi:hypothetical protein
MDIGKTLREIIIEPIEEPRLMPLEEPYEQPMIEEPVRQ